MKKVFISHPYYDYPELRKKQIDYICKSLRSKNILPISPIHLFSFIDEKTPELISEILDINATLIDRICNEIYIYNYGELSANQEWYIRFTEARNHNEKREIKIIEKEPPKICIEMG